MRVLELFAGSCAVSRAFAAHGWTGVCVDLKRPIDPPRGFEVWIWDVLNVTADYVRKFDFAWASSPCEEFSCFQMRHFRPNPPYPAQGIKLFNHTREILEQSGTPYVMENVRAAQEFVGPAMSHCGPFYLWGNAVPVIFPQGITKAKWYRREGKPGNFADELNLPKAERKAKLSTIPRELATCVAAYAERILEQRAVSAAHS